MKINADKKYWESVGYITVYEDIQEFTGIRGNALKCTTVVLHDNHGLIRILNSTITNDDLDNEQYNETSLTEFDMKEIIKKLNL